MNKPAIQEYRKRVSELEEEISKYEESITKIREVKHRLDNLYSEGRISYYQHQQIILEYFKGVLPEDLINDYKDKIDYCKSLIAYNQKQIDYEKQKARKDKIRSTIAITTVITLIITASIIINLTNRERTLKSPSIRAIEETFIETLNINTSKSIDYTWTQKNQGNLTSVKISGLIKGENPIKIYLDNKLILDSNLLYTSKTKELTFEKACVETCKLDKLKKVSYTIRIETNNTIVTITTLEYTIIRN